MFRFAVTASVVVGGTAKVDGTCGLECSLDEHCGGCGTAGICSCPYGLDIPYHETSCSCVSAPSNPPAEVTADISDSVWPDQWTASMEAMTYGDWTSTHTASTGKFYFDNILQRSRADWSVLHDKKGSAKQIWIADLDGSKPSSSYYVKTGVLCLYFPISDPGKEGDAKLTGVEHADWMKRMDDVGLAHYVGREQVNVNGVDAWTDHYSCRMEYEAVNQSITFQNWHSLGLDGIPKGLPLRVTGGNSQPDPQQSPRINSVWYYDFETGSDATSADDFKKPFGICVPVGAEEQKTFFGHTVTKDHIWSSEFHHRAHWAPHAKADARDLARARQPKPSRAFQGNDFTETMQKLNALLDREQGLQTQKCGDFSMATLHEMQRLLFNARTPELDAVYQDAADTRVMAHADMPSLKAEQARHQELTSDLSAKAADGICHEMVMWFIHHLSASAREEIKQHLVLPLLPEEQHQAPHPTAPDVHHKVHSLYTERTGCAVCHVAPSTITV